MFRFKLCKNKKWGQWGHFNEVSSFKVAEKILKKLSFYDPILVGTFPIDIDIPGSDLDIACEVSNYESFIQDLKKTFPDLKIKQEAHYVTGQMIRDGFPVEIYGEAKPVRQQNAYLHMKIEEYYLEKYGKDFKE